MYFNKQICEFHLDVETQEQLINKMSSMLENADCVKDTYGEAVFKRELEYPTGLIVNGTGIAIPHTDSIHVNESQICFCSLKQPIIFKDMTNIENEICVDLVFMLAMKQAHEQMDTLQNLVELFQDEEAINKLKKCNCKEDFTMLLNKANIK